MPSPPFVRPTAEECPVHPDAVVRGVCAADGPGVVTAVTRDPFASCLVAARVDPRRPSIVVGGRLLTRGDAARRLVFAGGNLMPVCGTTEDMWAVAAYLAGRPRGCTSVVGPAELVFDLWAVLELHWGQAREVREDQPLLALLEAPRIGGDPRLRRVRAAEFDTYLEASVRMFREELGTDPLARDGGRDYRRRVRAFVETGRAWGIFDGDELLFKAEIGALAPPVAQIHGIWVAPEARGRGLGASGTAAVAERVRERGLRPSLYVNSYNHAARAAYRRVGFCEVGRFATVIID